MAFAWTDIAAMTAFGTAVAGVLFWALLGRLGKNFVTKDDHDDTMERLKALETRLDQAPSHEDFKAVNASVARVELQMATMTERVEGVKGSLVRIEGALKMFVDARLQWEAKS